MTDGGHRGSKEDGWEVLGREVTHGGHDDCGGHGEYSLDCSHAKSDRGLQGSWRWVGGVGSCVRVGRGVTGGGHNDCGGHGE